MKSLEERASDFVEKVAAGEFIPRFIYNLMADCYCAAAEDERQLLTEWHDPKEDPQEGAELLLKILMPVDEGDIRTYAVGHYITDDFIMPNTYAGAKVLGWREIHENG